MNDSISKPAHPSVGELFMGFFITGISGFGGVLPFARRMIVEQRRWMTPAEFTDMWSLCQFLPGPNVVNMSLALGSRFQGKKGAAACLLGLLGAPFLIMIGVGFLYTTYGYIPEVKSVLRGIAAVSAGLVLSMSFKMAAASRARDWTLVFGVLAFVAIALMRLPLATVLVTLAPTSVLVAWLQLRKRARADRTVAADTKASP
jgi:chromate transporter